MVGKIRIVTSREAGRLACQLVLLLLVQIALVACRQPSELPRVLYLSFDDEGWAQLYVQSQRGEARKLTNVPFGVLDFLPSPDGEQVAFSAEREDGMSDIWLVGSDGANARRVLRCDTARCTGPVWRPDGELLIYERRDREARGEPALPLLFWLDPDSGQSVPVFDGEETAGNQARFSASGRYLAFLVPQVQEMRVVDLETGATATMENELGEAPAWHPELDAVLFSDIQIQGERFAAHILRADFPEQRLSNLSGNVAFSDNSAAWSPDGERIAFGRKLAGTATGRQIWIMAADGSQPQALTEMEDLQFSRPQWSPDGNLILVQRFDSDAPGAEPGLWTIDVNSGALADVATPAFQGIWLP